MAGQDDILHVFMNRLPLGEIDLIDEKGGMSLSYAPAWLADSGILVSPHLPPGAGPGQVRNFLANLLPEGEFLEELSITTGCSKANIFGLIAQIGAETAGALSFALNPGEEPPTTSFREIPRDELEERIAHRKTRSITVWDEKPRLSVAGVQAKLPVLIRPDGVIGLGEGELASTHILKFGKEPEQHLVHNEYLCMKLARAVGLPVAEVAFQRMGEPVLVVKRFDRSWAEDRVERLHLIDGCQLLDLPPTYKYERPFGKTGHAAGIRTGASLQLLFQACHDLCKVPAAAIKSLLDWTLFQLVIGNSDAHGKNLSFFVNRSGLFPAPAYDLISLTGYASVYDSDLAMAVGDCFDPDEVATFQLAYMCEECRLPRRQTSRTLKSLCERTLKALDALEVPAVSSEERDFVEALKGRIRQRAVRLTRFAQDLPLVVP